MTDAELDLAIEGLDYIFRQCEGFRAPPDEAAQEAVEEFCDFMGFHPGTLHKCWIPFEWLVGEMEDPDWAGENGDSLQVIRNSTDDVILKTEAEEPFIFVSTVVIRETYDRESRSDIWYYCLKILVRDKVCYAPLPIDQLDENAANHYKTLFTQIVLDA